MENSITALLKVSLENMKDIVDVDTIVGEAITRNNATIIPISKIHLGIISGGTDTSKSDKASIPIGGGTGGNITITPTAFIVIQDGDVRLLNVEEKSHFVEHLIDRLPTIMDKIDHLFIHKNKE